jgi:ADP-heptose:LPS heptosyltransferase/tetratricopeptide (TPR) repeat protein
LVQLGHCNKERREYRLSYESYMRAVNLKPADDDAYLHLGHLLKITGNMFCASRFYRAAAELGNMDAKSEYANIQAITTSPRFSVKEEAVGEARRRDGRSDGDARQITMILGALEMCEVDPSAVERLREAAQLLFLAGFAESAKGIFEMCFIREGFGPAAHARSIEVALRTGLWYGNGPFLQSSDISVRLSPFPIGRREALGWLVDEFAEKEVGRSVTLSGESAPALLHRPNQAVEESADSAHVHTLSVHRLFSPERAATVRDLVSSFYDALARASDADDWAQLRAVMGDLKLTVTDAGPLISFDTGSIRGNVEAHVARVLFNNLYDFISENAAIIVGPVATPGALASASRFKCPLLAPYLGGVSLLYDSPNELIDEIAFEIAQGARKYKDHPHRHMLEQVIALIGCRLEGDALLRLFTTVVEGNLLRAAVALLPALLPKYLNNYGILVQISQTLKHAGNFNMALDILHRIPQHESILRPASTEFGLLIERGILEKICGNFSESARIFMKCLSIDQENEFLQQEILTLLPEIHDMAKVVEQVSSAPKLKGLAQRRRLYRLHLDGWEFHGKETKVGPDVGVDELVLEIAPEVAKASESTRPPDRSEQVEILQLGWERRRSQWGDLPVLRGVEAIRVRVISLVPLIAMRVRLDGRTIRREQPRPQTSRFERKNEYMFNAWFDVSAIRYGLHELQLYFEEYSGGYRIREELVLVGPPLVRNEQSRTSGSSVVLDDSTAGLPLDERINSIPSVIYSTCRNFWHAPIRRVLVVRADQLGDFVISIPAIARLRDLFPDARFFGLISPSAVEMARTLELFEELFEVNMTYEPMDGRRYLALQDQIELRRQLGKHSFDLAIDLSTGSSTRPVLRLSGAPIMVGFKPHEFPWLSFGIDAVTRDAVNGRERVAHGTLVMMLVDALGTMLRSQHISMNPPPLSNDKGLLTRFGIGEDDHYLLLHTGSRLLMKQWPLAHYRALAHLALEATDLKVVMLVDTPAEAREIESVGFPTDRFCVVAGRLAFAELDALVSHCSAMVGNDSGPKHLAASRGAKVVSVHMGQVNWQEWGQEGDGLIVTRHVPCYGCGIVEAHECGKDLACLVHIRPEEVFAAVQQVLGTRVYRDPVTPETVAPVAHAR